MDGSAEGKFRVRAVRKEGSSSLQTVSDDRLCFESLTGRR